MSKIKVLPIYAEFPETYWSFKHCLDFIDKSSSMPPTGLLTAMAMFPQDKFEIMPVADLNVRPVRDEEIRKADVIATSTMIAQEESHNQIIARAHDADKQVIAGGAFPTAYPERVPADYLVTGEAEITLKPFLDDFLAGRARRIYNEENVILEGRAPSDLFPNGKPRIDSTPIPLWNLIDIKKYANMALQFSRGCPKDCDFCNITSLYGRNPRAKSAEQMIRELDALLNAGYRGSVFIVDDNLIGNRKGLEDFLTKLIPWQKKNSYPFTFFTEASVDLAWDKNKSILEGMVEAGFEETFVGFETLNEKALEEMNKRQNFKMPALEVTRRIQNAGMAVSSGFIIGNDQDTYSVFSDIYNFVQKAGIVMPMVGPLTAIKGTRLYEKLRNEGRLRGESNGNNTHNLGFNFDPKLPESFLVGGYVDLLGELFDSKNYFDRCRVLDRNLPKNKVLRGRGSIDLTDLKALGKSIKRQIFAEGGLEYAKYLGETIAKDPRELKNAVTHAVKLYHFQKLTKATQEEYNVQIKNR